MQPYIKTCYLYIDAGYIRKRLADAQLSEEFDPLFLKQYPESVLIGRAKVEVTRVFVYDGEDKSSPDQKVYLDKINCLPDTHVILGKIKTSTKNGRREQKGVDIKLAIDSLESAKSGVVDVIAIASGDADFAPLVEAIRRAGPHVLVLAFQTSISDDLRNVADRFLTLPDDPHNLPQYVLK